jgi:hypothetical protein
MFGAAAPDGGLDLIERSNARQRLGSNRRGAYFGDVEQLAAQMRPAKQSVSFA